MSATQRTNFFWSDWLGDQAVRRLTPAERGLWIDLLALAAGASPVGYVCDDRGRPLTLEEIARVTNAGSPNEVAELIAGILDKGAASRDRSGRLYNRRMVREAEQAAKKSALANKRAAAGKSGGFATQLKWQAFQTLPQQMPRQLPQHVPKQTLVNPFPKESKKDSSYSTAARFASAPCGGALASRPSTEQAQERGPPTKQVSELSRAELDAILSRKSASAEPEQPAGDEGIPEFLRRSA